MPSVRTAVHIPQTTTKKELWLGHVGHAVLNFVNQVSLLLGVSETLTVDVLCNVLDVFNYQILLVSEGLKRLLCYRSCFEVNYSLQLPPDHYWDSILPLEKVVWMLSHHIHSHRWIFLILSVPPSLTREPSAYCHRSQCISGSQDIYLLIFFFFFICFLQQINTVPNTWRYSNICWIAIKWARSTGKKKGKYNQNNFSVADMP